MALEISGKAVIFLTIADARKAASAVGSIGRVVQESRSRFWR
jgi:hypothetical protein